MKITIDQALEQAVTAHKAGQVQEADRLYSAILKVQPKHPDANHNLGVLAVSVGKMREAVPLLKTALEANPSIEQFWLSYIDVLINLGLSADAKAIVDQAKSSGVKGSLLDMLEKKLKGLTLGSNGNIAKVQDPPRDQIQSLINLYSQGQLQRALQQVETLGQQYPKSATLLNIQGAIFKGLGQSDLSVEAYKKALSIKPDYAEAHNNIGNAFKEQGKFDEAIEAYNKALVIKPDYAEAYNNMGVSLQEQGKFAEAMEAYNKALSIKPSNAEAYNNMGSAFEEQGKFAEAIEAYDKALSIKPSNAEAYNNMGNAFKEQGKLEEAIEAYNKALAIKPNYADAYNNLGNAFKEQNKLAEATVAYNKALTITPNYAEAYNNMGVSLQGQDKLEEAIQAYQKALDINPNYAEAYNNMSYALKEHGKLAEAIEACNKALSIKPNYAQAYNNMGITLREQDKLEEAIEAYNKALDINPNYAEAYSNMGVSLQEQGKLAKATEAYNKALSIKPNYAEAYNNMGTLLQEQGNLEAALEAYNKALAIKPDFAMAYSNKSFAMLQSNCWRDGIELRRWRWKTKKHQVYKRSFTAQEWDGKEFIHNKTLLVWAEQGPGDVVIWASCIDYCSKICEKVIIECQPKLVDLFTRSFPNVLVRFPENSPVESVEDFDFHVPMETLFGYACLAGACTELQSKYLFPDPQRINYWRGQLRQISTLKTVGLSWKSPVMTTQRSKNYPPLSYWGKALQRDDLTFINLQSTEYESDINYLLHNFGCKIVHMSELDLYDDLADVAALSQALDCCISVATAAATISAAVGTYTIIPTWAQSPWNNILFNSRGPNLDILQKNTGDTWNEVFTAITTRLNEL